MSRDHVPELVGVSSAIVNASRSIRRFARSGLSVLVVGPSGTGKEMVARAIHRESGRAGPLVDINCAALPRDLVEGQLFGHRRGAFTGADRDMPGLVAAAHCGTLFLDELTSLPLEAQAKLLRVLETREVRRVGDVGAATVDFRAVAAAQNDGWAGNEAGKVRLDLMYRLGEVVIKLPPLQERPADIVPLAEHFAASHSRGIAASGARRLLAWPWPGNVRELRTVVDRAVMLTPAPLLDGVALQESITHGLEAGHSGNLGLDGERASWVSLLEVSGFSVDRIGERLGLSRATVFRRLRRLGISVRRERRVTAAAASGTESLTSSRDHLRL